VWKRSKATEFKDVLCDEFVERLRLGAHLVITGGEPLLHQETIAEYIIWFRDTYGLVPFIEVETNGTIIPTEFLLTYVQQWNCSPKLANSGEPAHKRINEVALMLLKDYGACFKFVSGEGDILEVFQDFNVGRNIVLMPCGQTQEELNAGRIFVAEAAIKLGVRYSDRLHVVIWNKKTGV
jgi:organic radical activating enzyme